MRIDKDSPNIISKENIKLFEYIEEMWQTSQYIEAYHINGNRIWTCMVIFGYDFYELPFTNSNLDYEFSLNNNKIICFSPESREYAFVFDANDLRSYEDIDKMCFLMRCLNKSRCVFIGTVSSINKIYKNSTMKKCNCNEVLLDEILKHDDKTAIEIQFINDNIEVVIYETHHNENGGHNESRFIIKTNYCPICGKCLTK